MKIIQKGVIFSPVETHPFSEVYYHNFNHAPNLIKLSEHNFLAAWFSGPWEGHPFQRILISRFDGSQWSEPKVFQNTKGVSDFDPAFVRSGSKICLFYSNARWFSPRLHGEKKGFLGTYYKWTADAGQSWSEPCLLSEDHACKSNGFCLENGCLLLPVYNHKLNLAGVFKSTDEGDNWELHECDPISIGMGEPSVIELIEGHILMIARTKKGTLWISESMDTGKNWSNPKSSGIASNNTPASLLKKNNSILICYNCGNLRDKLHLSSTESLSFQWDSTLVVDQISDNSLLKDKSIHPSGSDCAVTYPSIINYNDSKIMLAWSRYEINENEHKGEICYCIVEIEEDSFAL